MSMKNLSIIIFLISISIKSQVGINTTTPQGTLDVNGGLLIDSYLVDTVNSIADGNYYLLTRSRDTTPVGKVKILDVSLRNVAPVNIYKININNVKQDEVINLNTGLDVNKYVVAITNAVFKNAEPIAVVNNGIYSYGTYFTEIAKTTVGANTFFTINLDFKGAGTLSSQNGNWELSLVVYEKALLKEWGNYTGSVSASATPSYTGTSTNTPLGLQ